MRELAFGAISVLITIWLVIGSAKLPGIARFHGDGSIRRGFRKLRVQFSAASLVNTVGLILLLVVQWAKIRYPDADTNWLAHLDWLQVLGLGLCGVSALAKIRLSTHEAVCEWGWVGALGLTIGIVAVLSLI